MFGKRRIPCEEIPPTLRLIFTAQALLSVKAAHRLTFNLRRGGDDNKDMLKYGLLIVGMVATTALAAQEEALPQPKVLPGTAKDHPLPSTTEDPGRDLKELQRWVNKLKMERESLAAEQNGARQQMVTDVFSENVDTMKLRLQISELIKKVSTPKIPARNTDPIGPVLPPPKSSGDKKSAPPPPKPVNDKPPPREVVEENAEAPADPVALANVLFRAGHTEQALKTYRLVNMTGMRSKERGPLMYLTACCLRKLGKTEAALSMFRDVANLKGDEEVAACAQWQIAQIRWRGECEAQLKEVRARRQALEREP